MGTANSHSLRHFQLIRPAARLTPIFPFTTIFISHLLQSTTLVASSTPVSLTPSAIMRTGTDPQFTGESAKPERRVRNGNLMDTTKNYIESGAWIGRQQAFAVIASKCSAAQALALKEMKASGAYQQLGLTWQDFCLQYVGVSRERTDALIRQYDEFGEAYFRLSQIAQISPETYRDIAPKVEGGAVEIDGQRIELTLPNANRIRAAIKKMRDERNQARRAADLREPLDLDALRHRQEALIEEVRRLSYYFQPNSGRPALVAFATHAINRWKEVSRELAET